MFNLQDMLKKLPSRKVAQDAHRPTPSLAKMVLLWGLLASEWPGSRWTWPSLKVSIAWNAAKSCNSQQFHERSMGRKPCLAASSSVQNQVSPCSGLIIT